MRTGFPCFSKEFFNFCAETISRLLPAVGSLSKKVQFWFSGNGSSMYL